MLRGLALLLLLSLGATPSPAGEDAPDPRHTHRVVGVAADDVLNVREQPDPRARRIGALQPGASGVVVTGVQQRVGGQRWWEVVHGEAGRGAGWVNARFLAPEDVAPAAGFDLRCGGTEPFWSLEIAGGRATFERMGEAAGIFPASSWMDSAGRPEGHRFAIRLDGPEGTPPGWATVGRADRHCSDDMSEREYPYDVIVVLPGEGGVIDGCCARAR
jgi:uncharacterized membrane protein